MNQITTKPTPAVCDVTGFVASPRTSHEAPTLKAIHALVMSPGLFTMGDAIARLQLIGEMAENALEGGR